MKITKTDQRNLYRTLRNSLNATEIKEYSTKIYKKLIQTSEYAEAEKILIYCSIGSEVNTEKIINHAINTGKTVAIPKTFPDRIAFYEIKNLQNTKLSKMNIPEPIINKISQQITPCEKTLIIIPGLCFDKRGNRIGYGGGYYDKYLAQHADKKHKKIGLCYEIQIAETVCADAHDIKVDKVITEF